MRENPRVCIEVDEMIDRTQWTTVIAFGTYEELLHMPSQEADRQRAQELFRSAPEWWQPAASNPQQEVRMAMVYRIRIESLTGRLAERQQEGPGGRPWWLDLLFEEGRVDRHSLRYYQFDALDREPAAATVVPLPNAGRRTRKPG